MTQYFHTLLCPPIFFIIPQTSPLQVVLPVDPQNFLQYALFACLTVFLTVAWVCLYWIRCFKLWDLLTSLNQCLVSKLLFCTYQLFLPLLVLFRACCRWCCILPYFTIKHFCVYTNHVTIKLFFWSSGDELVTWMGVSNEALDINNHVTTVTRYKH